MSFWAIASRPIPSAVETSRPTGKLITPASPERTMIIASSPANSPASISSATIRNSAGMPSGSPGTRRGRCGNLTMSAKAKRPDGDRAAVSLAKLGVFRLKLVNLVGQLQQPLAPIALHAGAVEYPEGHLPAGLQPLAHLGLGVVVIAGEVKGVENVAWVKV